MHHLVCTKAYVRGESYANTSKYPAWTDVEYNNSKHLIMKEDDIVGILESDDVKDMKPLNDRILIKVFIYNNVV